MKRIPLYDATAPIACTASGPELAERGEQLARFKAELLAVERTEHGLALRLPAAMEDEVRRFAVDEKRCCDFWGFAVDVDTAAEHVTLRWDAPPDAAALLDQVADYLT